MVSPPAERMRAAVRAHAAALAAAVARAPRSERSQHEERPFSAAHSGFEGSAAEIFSGAWHETAFGPTLVCDAWLPADHQQGRVSFASLLDAELGGLARLFGAAVSSPERLAFFDIETTGLSGGTGTYAFLIGLGSFEPDGFRLRQYFLAGVEQERAMLDLLARDLAAFEGIVTYNGRAFDVPLVMTRMTLARQACSIASLPHIDLLHVVRRLYRHRMTSCRLADAEQRLLKMEREDDVPGWLVAARYLDYVHAGRVAPLRAVFRHNADDVLSLAAILSALASICASDAPEPEDAVALARWYERAGEEARAAGLYRAALPWLEGTPDWLWAAARHARLCRRSGGRDEAAGIWRRLWAAGDRAAGLALAKHLEHHDRDHAAAAAIGRELLAGAPAGERDPLEHRLRRLSGKLLARA